MTVRSDWVASIWEGVGETGGRLRLGGSLAVRLGGKLPEAARKEGAWRDGSAWVSWGSLVASLIRTSTVIAPILGAEAEVGECVLILKISSCMVVPLKDETVLVPHASAELEFGAIPVP